LFEEMSRFDSHFPWYNGTRLRDHWGSGILCSDCAIDDVEKLPIAYLNTDSLLVNYLFAQDANEKLMKKQEDARLKLNTKLRTFQNEVADFQRKLENNAFLSRERAEKEQQRLAKKEQELQELEAKLTQDIMLENQKLNMQLADSLNTFLGIFNSDGRYHIILSNNAKDNVLMASEQYDITSEVIEGMNARYSK
jgi:outer membrane protein